METKEVGNAKSLVIGVGLVDDQGSRSTPGDFRSKRYEPTNLRRLVLEVDAWLCYVGIDKTSIQELPWHTHVNHKGKEQKVEWNIERLEEKNEWYVLEPRQDPYYPVYPKTGENAPDTPPP